MHIDYNQGTIRFYAEGRSFENHDPYECSMMFIVLSPAVVYIYDAAGKMTKERYAEGFDALKQKGYEYVFCWLPTKFKPVGFMQLLMTDLHFKKL